MQLRPYQPGDFDQCLTVFDSNMLKYFMPHERAEFAQFIQTTTEPYFVLTSEQVVVGEGRGGETIIGCGGYFLRVDQSAGLSWGMVARNQHGTGAGRFLLMARLQRICEETTVERVLLNTSQHTHGFFAKVGFMVDEIVNDGFGPGLDEYKMTLHLQPNWCTAHGY